MLEKIKQIKTDHPVAFWIFCVVVFPGGLLLLLLFLFGKKEPTDRQLMENAAHSEGEATVFAEQAKTTELEIKKQEQDLSNKKKGLMRLVQKLNSEQAKLKKVEKQIEQMDTWAEVDKESNAK